MNVKLCVYILCHVNRSVRQLAKPNFVCVCMWNGAELQMWPQIRCNRLTAWLKIEWCEPKELRHNEQVGYRTHMVEKGITQGHTEHFTHFSKQRQIYSLPLSLLDALVCPSSSTLFLLTSCFFVLFPLRKRVGIVCNICFYFFATHSSHPRHLKPLM